MHGPGEPNKRNETDKNETDKKIAADLAKATLEDVERALGLFDKTRDGSFCGFFKTLSLRSLSRLWWRSIVKG